MFDENRSVEGCAHDYSTPSAAFFRDLPELFEKNSLQQQQNTLLMTAAQADYDAALPLCREASGVLRPGEDEMSEVCGGLLFDGPDDLEALLGFTDQDCNHLGLLPVAGGNQPPHELPLRMNKRACEEVEDEDEVESKLCNKRQKSEEPSSLDGSVNGTVSAVTAPPCDEQKFEDKFCLDQSTDELQMLCDDFGFELPEQQCSSCSPDGAGDSISSGSAKQSRRRKMKDTVRLLREAIPGGDCMDTAIVLDEAINYVKLLQLQVQALGAQRLAERANR